MMEQYGGGRGVKQVSPSILRLRKCRKIISYKEWISVSDSPITVPFRELVFSYSHIGLGFFIVYCTIVLWEPTL